MSTVATGQRLAPGQQVQTFRYWRLCAWAGPFAVLYMVWGLLIAKGIERGIERETDNNVKTGEEVSWSE